MTISENATGTNERWMSVGVSSLPDAQSAAREAVERALEGRSDAKLLVVLASVDYDLASLAAAIKGAAPQVPMVGSSTQGEISTSGPADSSVVITAIGGPGLNIKVGASHSVTEDRQVKAVEATSFLDDMELFEHSALMLFQDGVGAGQDDTIRGAYSVAGAGIPLVGGCSVPDVNMEGSSQLFEGKVLTDSVVCAAISSTAPIGIGVRSGWVAITQPLMVTKSDGQFVYELDGRPALDVYLEHLNAPPEVWEDPNLYVNYSLTHPLAINRRSGDEAHTSLFADYEARSIFCPRIPEGVLVNIMEGDESTILGANEGACSAALEGLDGAEAMGAFVFNCASRKIILGPRTEEEISDIANRIGGPIAGFYTYGEMARVTGAYGIHNQTLVVMALA